MGDTGQKEEEERAVENSSAVADAAAVGVFVTADKLVAL